MEYNDTAIIDLDFELAAVENVLLNYLCYPAGGVYIANNRLPVDSTYIRESYGKAGWIYDNPQLPIFAAALFTDIGYAIIYDHNPFRELVKSNTLLSDVVESQLYPVPPKGLNTPGEYIMDLVPTISNDDFNTVLTIVNTYVTILNKIIEHHGVTRSYTIDSNSNVFKLLVGEPVVEIRYAELKEYNATIKESKASKELLWDNPTY